MIVWNNATHAKAGPSYNSESRSERRFCLGDTTGELFNFRDFLCAQAEVACAHHTFGLPPISRANNCTCY